MTEHVRKILLICSLHCVMVKAFINTPPGVKQIKHLNFHFHFLMDMIVYKIKLGLKVTLKHLKENYLRGESSLLLEFQFL